MKIPPLLIDIMENGRFVCQVAYPVQPMKIKVRNKVRYSYEGLDIERYVYKTHPELKGRDIRYEFTEERKI